MSSPVLSSTACDLRARYHSKKTSNFTYTLTNDLDVVVEGIETVAQARLCRELGADMLQGYLFAKALSPDDFVAFLNAHDPVRYRTLSSND
jgi:predicted signal transduction protein with EAL and GGDEF domain